LADPYDWVSKEILRLADEHERLSECAETKDADAFSLCRKDPAPKLYRSNDYPETDERYKPTNRNIQSVRSCSPRILDQITISERNFQ
jgi:hypothetical protein